MIAGARGTALTIGGPGDSRYYVRMTAIGEDVVTCCSIPHLHGLVFACRGYVSSVRRPGHGKHPSSMAVISEDEELRRERGRSGRCSSIDRTDARAASSQVQAH